MAVCKAVAKGKNEKGWVFYYEYLPGSETIFVIQVSMATTLDLETFREVAARSIKYTMAFSSAEEAEDYFDCECEEPL